VGLAIHALILARTVAPVTVEISSAVNDSNNPYFIFVHSIEQSVGSENQLAQIRVLQFGNDSPTL